MNQHNLTLEEINRVRVLAVFMEGFLVVFVLFQNIVEFCDSLLMPHDGVFQRLEALLEIDRTLQCPALTTSDRDWINQSGNRFSALTDVELVLTVVLAVLDFTKAEGLGVGGGWVHIAMILVCCLDPLTLSRLGTGA